jgi:hypothetical protein
VEIMGSSIFDWKKFLKNHGLFNGEVNSSDIDSAFKRGMQNLEDIFTKDIPSIKGMIWQGSVPNPSAVISDVEDALGLLKSASLKFGQADFDSLGKPGPDQISTIFNQMFISQEDSKLDEHTPGGNQNQGRWQNNIPQTIESEEIVKHPKTSPDIDERMQLLTKLMDSVKK